MSENSWSDGLKTGAFKNRGANRWKRGQHKKSGKTPRVGIRKRRMARRK